MTFKLQEVANFGWCKLFTLFMFVYDKNKDTPLWIGSVGLVQVWSTWHMSYISQAWTNTYTVILHGRKSARTACNLAVALGDERRLNRSTSPNDFLMKQDFLMEGYWQSHQIPRGSQPLLCHSSWRYESWIQCICQWVLQHKRNHPHQYKSIWDKTRYIMHTKGIAPKY